MAGAKVQYDAVEIASECVRRGLDVYPLVIRHYIEKGLRYKKDKSGIIADVIKDSTLELYHSLTEKLTKNGWLTGKMG